MMGWDPVLGILIGFVFVVAYCYAGGIRVVDGRCNHA